jgi:hypothetical protein
MTNGAITRTDTIRLTARRQAVVHARTAFGQLLPKALAHR